jgi:hypothetical protein
VPGIAWALADGATRSGVAANTATRPARRSTRILSM